MCFTDVNYNEGRECSIKHLIALIHIATDLYFVGVFMYTVHLSLFPAKARLLNKVSTIYIHGYVHCLCIYIYIYICMHWSWVNIYVSFRSNNNSQIVVIM